MSDIPTSGMISINQMHTEAGGTSGTPCTLNDADIRGLINKSSGAAMNFGEWYGASAILDTQTVTVGYQAPSLYGAESKGYATAAVNTVAIGSISDGTLNPVSNKPIGGLLWIGQNATGNIALNAVYLILTGTPASNSGFTTMKVGSTSYNRTSATFTTTSDRTQWKWSTTTSPFSATGTNTTVEFT